MRKKSDFMKRFLVLAMVGILFLSISFNEVMAAEFPEKPIKIVVGYAVGGVVDLTARMLANLATEALEKPVITVSKPGAAGTIGAADVASSKPDGYTIGCTAGSTMALGHLTVKVKYDPQKDIEPLAIYGASLLGICVLKDAPWKTFRELIEYARKNPGELTVSTSGAVSNTGIIIETIAKRENIKIKQVPYPGGAPAAAALLGGHVKAHLGSGSQLPFVESGKFRMLAVNSFTNLRSPDYPDIPSLKDLGYDLPASNYQLLIMPAGIPKPILSKLEDVFGKAIKSKVFRDFQRQLLNDIVFEDQEGSKRVFERESRLWKGMLKEIDYKQQ